MGLIKFLNKAKRVVYVLCDQDTEPREINETVKKELDRLGIKVIDQDDVEDKSKKSKLPTGVSQDDLTYLQGDKYDSK